VPMRVPFVTTLFLLLLVVMPTTVRAAKRVASAMHPLKHLPFEMRGREAVAGALDEASSPS
jgi:fumarate reductase subunit D